MLRPLQLLLVGFTFALLPASSMAQPVSDARAEFAVAYAAPSLDSSSDSEALRAYPLYPWLQAARLRQRVASGDSEEAIRFAEAAGEVAHVRDLRRALLKAAAEAGDGKGFIALWRESAANEALRCQLLDARRQTGDTATLASDIAERWIAEDTLPETCAASFAWLKTQPLYTPVLVERRLRARLLDGDSSRARALLPALPVERRARFEAWLRQLATPADEFATLAEGTPQLLDSEGLADTWMRWARKSPAEAAALLDAVAAAQKLSDIQTQTLQRNTALALAWNRDVDAVQLFRQVPEALIDERSHEWRVRAALWAGEWNQAFNWLTLMPQYLGEQPRWRYWNARALETLGQKGEAFQRYSSLAKENDTYGLLAAWRAGKGWTPINEPKPITPEQRAALDATPALVRAREAWQAGQKSIASLEWADAIEALSETARPALVREAAALGWYDQAIVTATRLGIFRDLETLFPRPYADIAKPAAEAAGIPVQWLYGVMRKESAFKPDATSSAGALGLLQMMPGTAAMTAKAAGQAAPSNDDLKNPDINIPLGALHLREVLDKSDGRWQMALAAYNAGFRAVTRWRPPSTMEADVWIENIPFNETRTYVQRILFHVGVYQWLETKKPVRANNWLPMVEPAPVVTP
ncbi:MAG: transglycosylase SLT domain-containing protein [Pseudomonadota bacterium]